MTRVLVLAEHRRRELREVTLEMIRAAEAFPGAESTVVVPGAAAAPLAEALAPFAARVLLLDHPLLDAYSPPEYAAALRQVVEREDPEVVLLPHSYRGMDLAGRLAAVLHRPFVTDAVGIRPGDGGLEIDRQVYGGRVHCRLVLPPGEPVVLSVRPTTFPAAEPRGSPGAVEAFRPEGLPEAPAVRFLEYVEEAAGEVDITQAEVIVAAGRGIGEEENLALVRELADALGGVLACSRPIVDRGWLPRSRQVGTSGRAVRPKVYVAVGISGAFQHVAGMAGAGRVIAINRDPNAPIFKVADYGVVGDLFRVVPAIVEAARSRGS